MIEKIKSILLMLLVALSLFMTYQLWYGQKPAQLIAEDVFERVIAEQPRPLEEVLTPEKIVVNAEEGYYIFRQGDPDFIILWEAVSQVLQEGSSSFMVEDNMVEGDFNNLLTLYFNPVLPVGADLPWLSEAPDSTVRAIKINSLEDKIWFELFERDNVSGLSLLLLPEITEIIAGLIADRGSENLVNHALLTDDLILAVMEKNLNLTEPIYVPMETVEMERLVLKPEEIDSDLILKTFFIDYNLARIIEEKDGGLIYTDGDRGLRLSSTGFEYSAPRLEDGQANASYPDAMFNSSSVIGYHGGWPESLRLVSLYLTGRGRTGYYIAEWQAYHQGYPLFTRQGTRAFFNDRGLIHFSRNAFTSSNLPLENGEEVHAAVWSEALREAVNLYHTNESQLGNEIQVADLNIEAVDLGYAVVGSDASYKGEPVWFIQINGEKFFLKADNLEPLSEEELI